VEAFVAAAHEAESADDYRIAAVTSLPFEDHSFDLAVAYNVLMDVDDIPAAVKEITPGSASLRHTHCIRCPSFR
jgi:Methyltransferase domain